MHNGEVGPRIDALRSATREGGSQALARFWQEVERDGTPLVEPIPDDADHSFVTFLWRGGDEVANVLVLVPWGMRDLAEDLMERLDGSDVWYRTYRVPNDMSASYQLSLNDSLVPFEEVVIDEWETRMATFREDPLNPRMLLFPPLDQRPEESASILELPDTPQQPWVAPRPGVPSGELQLHLIRSEILQNERRLWVYTPPGYLDDTNPCELLIVFDGWPYTTTVPTPTILDNLLAEGRIPPTVAVFVDNPGATLKETNETRSRELPCYRPFADFLAGEIVPWVRGRYRVSLDPAHATVAGSSFGGLAATFAGFTHSEIFGNVLSQSGSFWWRPDYEPSTGKTTDEEGEDWEWLGRQFAAAPHLPLRFYLDVGNLETRAVPGGPSQLDANRRMCDTLISKCYPLHYVEYTGGHDYLPWQGTLADGLLALRALRAENPVGF